MTHLLPRMTLRLFLIPTLVVLSAVWTNPSHAAGISVTLLAEGDSQFIRPLDAAPSPDGTVVYFVAHTAKGAPGVFRVPADGGVVEPLVTGLPLKAPSNLVVASDGQTLYVADPAARHNGAVFAIAIGNSARQIVPGTSDLRPRALDLVRQGTSDVLYIVGTDRRTHRAGIWRLILGTTTSPTQILRGSPLASAEGIAVTSSGDIFVAGRTGRGHKTDVVLQITGRTHRRVIKDVTLGSPAGLALTLDESTLLVSSQAQDGTSQVLLLDLATGSTSVFNDVIGVNRISGGLHRALHVNMFAWAGNSPPGRVYRVDP